MEKEQEALHRGKPGGSTERDAVLFIADARPRTLNISLTKRDEQKSCRSEGLERSKRSKRAKLEFRYSFALFEFNSGKFVFRNARAIERNGVEREEEEEEVFEARTGERGRKGAGASRRSGERGQRGALSSEVERLRRGGTRMGRRDETWDGPGRGTRGGGGYEEEGEGATR